jgi:hypothetical protein
MKKITGWIRWLNDHNVVVTIGIIAAVADATATYVAASGWTLEMVSGLIPVALAAYARTQVTSKATLREG